jgi:hypothetical protein
MVVGYELLKYEIQSFSSLIVTCLVLATRHSFQRTSKWEILHDPLFDCPWTIIKTIPKKIHTYLVCKPDYLFFKT